MGPGTKKPAERTNKGNLSDIFKFMLDQGAGTARGIYRGTVGLPGDLESLVRLGIGGEQYLPTSEDVGKPGKWYSAPPLKPLLKGDNPYDTIGQFYNLPIYGGAAKAGVRGLKHFGNKAVNGPFDESKRAFGKKAAAIGGAAALAPMIKLSEHLAPAVKKADDFIPVEDMNKFIKEPAKAVSKHKFNSLKEYNDYLNERVLKEQPDQHYLLNGIDDLEAENLYKQNKVFSKSRIARQEEDSYNRLKKTQDIYDRGGSGSESWDDWMEYDRFSHTLNAFSPQAKAEMKAFKNSVIDPADEAFRAGAPHWSELLDDYIKWNHDIPY